MDNYNEPPVYRAAYELTLAVFRFVKDCDKNYRATLGIILEKEALNLEAVIYRINESGSQESKAQAIQQALDSCYQIRMIIRLMIDLGIMKIDTNINLNLKIEETAKQLAGWKKSCQ